MKSKQIPVTLMLDREAYEEYKQLGKEKGFTPKVKITEQANSFMKKQTSKG